MEKIKEFAEILDVNARSLWNLSLGGSTKQMECFERIKNIEIGDLVVEISSAGMGCPAINRVGYLREIIKREDGEIHYIIEKLNGKTIDWSNCQFIKILTEFKYFS